MKGFILDLALILLVIGTMKEGYRKGLSRSASELIAMVGALFFAFGNTHLLRSFSYSLLSLPEGLANLVSFAILFVCFIFFFFVILGALPEKIYLYIFNPNQLNWSRMAGATVEGVKTLLTISLVVATLAFFPVSYSFASIIKSSFLGSYLANQTYGFESSIKRIFVKPVEEGMFFNTIMKSRYNTPSRPGRPPEKYLKRITKDELLLIALTNQERKRSGLPLLKYDKKLTKTALKHSYDMFRRDYFDHISPDKKDVINRLNEEGVTFSLAGENLALAGDVLIAHKGLMNSPGHRANILDPQYTRIGIGAVDAGPFQQIFTQNFAD